MLTDTTTDGVVGKKTIITYDRMNSDGLYWADYANNDSLIPTLGAVGYELEQKQSKMACAEWPDGVAHTDKNCWLRYKN